MKFTQRLLYFLLMLHLYVFVLITPGQTRDNIPDPDSHFGFHPGEDRMLFTYEDLIDYLKKVESVSSQVKLVEIGMSPMGRKMYIAFVSSEDNIRNLDKLRMINEKLALDPLLPREERTALINDGRVFVLATLSMHSDEVGPSQAAPLIIYDLLTTSDSQKLQWLNDVVFMMVPCHNPDGMNMVVNHYKKYKGTKYEGSSMPGIYHKYVGHDNNRDFVILSQEDTKAIDGIFSQTWYPQVLVEKHEMGSTGPRYFVPPNHDPIAENVESGIWNWSGLFGANLIKYMTAKGLSGISQHYIFDDYWPGSTETCIWKNIIGFLTECAGADYAKPVYIEPSELHVYGKGLSEYKKSINMPELWPGGWWRLADIVEYEVESTFSILETASLYREKILEFRNDICQREVKKGASEAPYYYIIPREQHDSSELVGLINLLREHGIKVYRLSEAILLAGRKFEKNDFVVPLAQPFRPFIKEVMEKQEFPVRHYTPDGKIIKPYDITSWSLPLHRGILSIEINRRYKELEDRLLPIEKTYDMNSKAPANYRAAVFNVQNNESFKAIFQAVKQGLTVERTKEENTIGDTVIPAGSFLIQNRSESFNKWIEMLSVAPLYLKNKTDWKTTVIKIPRIALVETFFHDMDAGWTRFIFDQYGLPYTIVRPGKFEDITFEKEYDMVVFPDAPKSILMEGKWKSDDEYQISSYPPEFTKGMGKEGMKKLMTFLDKGGLIVSWGRSTRLFKGNLEIPTGKEKGEEFQLPFNDISESLQKAGLYCPGSLVKIKIVSDHPLTFGIPSEIGVFYRGRPVFTSSLPYFDMDRRVIAGFPEKNILMSGYCENEEKIGNKSAMIWLKKGKGQLVLIAFNPQFRASTQASYKLLFNAVLLKNHL